jgi:hypothetical protein
MTQPSIQSDEFLKSRSDLEEILPAFKDKWAKSRPRGEKQQCIRLISLLGGSPLTTVLATAALQPKELVVITSEKAKDDGPYDRAVKLIEEFVPLKSSQMRFEVVNIIDPKNIYNTVAANIQDRNTFVDITGGTKSMTAAAVQAAWENNAQSCCIQSQYDDSNQPKSKTQQLLLLENPSEAKAKKWREKGVDAWKNRNFSLARDAFKESEKLNLDPRFEEVSLKLCDFYENLFNFDVKNLKKSLQEIKKIKDKVSLQDILKRIDLQTLVELFDTEEPLADPATKIAVFLSLSQEYSKLERYDFAGLLAYRAIEELIDEGLRQLSKDASFDRGKPEYEKLTTDVGKLQQQFCDLSSKLDKSTRKVKSLPEKIGLGDGYALLILLAPAQYGSVFGNAKKKPIDVLKSILGICSSRNESILAHGNTPLGEKKYQAMYGLAENISKIIAGNSIIDLIKKITPPGLGELLP